MISEHIDGIDVHEDLNPEFWSNETLHEDVRQHILDVANAFIDSFDIIINYTDIVLTGSLANYNYTKYSDVDVHILVDLNTFDCPDMAKELFMTKRLQWASQHHITIHGHLIELYIQGNDDANFGAMYSCVSNTWLSQPSKIDPKIDEHLITVKASDFVKRIQNAMKHRDVQQLDIIKHDIYRLRISGLEKIGEWSTENLVFKTLRNHGVIDMLKKSADEIWDINLSLP